MSTKRRWWIEVGVSGVAALAVGAIAAAQPARRAAPAIVVFSGAASGTAAPPRAYEEIARPTGAAVPRLSARVRTQVRAGIATALGVPAQSLTEPAVASGTVFDSSAGSGSLSGGAGGTSSGGGGTSGGATTEGASSGGSTTGGTGTLAVGTQPAQTTGSTSGGGGTVAADTSPAQTTTSGTLAAGTTVALEVGAVARQGVALEAARPTFAMAGWHWWYDASPQPMSFAVGFTTPPPAASTTTAYELDCAVASSTARRLSVAIVTETAAGSVEETREVPITFTGAQPPLGDTGRLVVAFTVPAGARPRMVRATAVSGFALQSCELARWR